MLASSARVRACTQTNQTQARADSNSARYTREQLKIILYIIYYIIHLYIDIINMILLKNVLNNDITVQLYAIYTFIILLGMYE